MAQLTRLAGLELAKTLSHLSPDTPNSRLMCSFSLADGVSPAVLLVVVESLEQLNFLGSLCIFRQAIIIQSLFICVSVPLLCPLQRASSHFKGDQKEKKFPACYS